MYTENVQHHLKVLTFSLEVTHSNSIKAIKYSPTIIMNQIDSGETLGAIKMRKFKLTRMTAIFSVNRHF